MAHKIIQAFAALDNKLFAITQPEHSEDYPTEDSEQAIAKESLREAVSTRTFVFEGYQFDVLVEGHYQFVLMVEQGYQKELAYPILEYMRDLCLAMYTDLAISNPHVAEHKVIKHRYQNYLKQIKEQCNTPKAQRQILKGSYEFNVVEISDEEAFALSKVQKPEQPHQAKKEKQFQVQSKQQQHQF